MVILKTKQSFKTLPVLLGSGSGEFFKKAIEVGGIREIEVISDLLCGPIAPKLSFNFRKQPVMDHLLRGKPAVLPADFIEMCRTDPEHLRIICDAVPAHKLLFQQ